MLKLLIIADDFTGALDTGVQFSKQGAKTFVTADREVDFGSVGNDTEVLCVDTESRHIPRAEAYARVFALAAKARDSGLPHIYKKTDSTLRGNIGAELEAAALGFGGSVMFAPAYPKNGRTTKGGIQYVSGIPLGETAISRDPIDPVTCSSVAGIIARQSGLRTINVSAAGGADLSQKGCVYIFDSESDGELDLIGRAIKKAGAVRVLAGCAGFAEKLPGLLGLSRSDFGSKPHGGNILVVSGSVNRVSLAQLDAAAEAGFGDVVLTPRQKLGADPEAEEARTEAAGGLIKGLVGGGRMILRAVGSPDDMALAELYAEASFISPAAVPKIVAQSMASVVRAAVESGSADNLVVFGGDTLLAVMEKLGVRGVVPHTEIAPGIAVSTALRDAGALEIISKAGGFGDIGIISAIEDYVNLRTGARI